MNIKFLSLNKFISSISLFLDPIHMFHIFISSNSLIPGPHAYVSLVHKNFITNFIQEKKVYLKGLIEQWLPNSLKPDRVLNQMYEIIKVE